MQDPCAELHGGWHGRVPRPLPQEGVCAGRSGQRQLHVVQVGECLRVSAAWSGAGGCYDDMPRYKNYYILLSDFRPYVCKKNLKR